MLYAYLIVLQLFMAYWIFHQKHAVRTLHTYTHRHSLTTAIAINAWIVVFVTQMIFGPIFPFNIGLASIYAGLTIYTLGVGLAFWARHSIGTNWGLPLEHNIRIQKNLVTSGAYKLSRNPIYVAELLMLLGFELATQSWLVLLIVPFFIFNAWKIRKEEVYLRTYFGKKYEAYRERTRRFI